MTWWAITVLIIAIIEIAQLARGSDDVSRGGVALAWSIIAAVTIAASVVLERVP